MRCDVDRSPQPHEAGLLHLDCRKARERLGWRPVWDAGDDVRAHRVAGTGGSTSAARVASRADIERYVADARRAGLPWAVGAHRRSRMKLQATPIAGLWEVETAPHRDERGSLTRLFCADELRRGASRTCASSR